MPNDKIYWMKGSDDVSKGILVPFDGSANAMAAVKEAAVLSRALGEEILLLTVQPSYETIHSKMFFSKKDIAEFQQQQGREILAPAEEYLQAQTVAFSSKIRAGNPPEQIVAEAHGAEEGCPFGEGGARMIVMGCRGLTPVVGSILGSVSYGVLHQIHCPVYLVPPPCAETVEREDVIPT